jgi:predicted amidohydrolase YtcJ
MSEKEETIYINGDIVTMDSANRRCQALAARGDRILALGTNEEIKSMAKAGTKEVDLGGKTVFPGFIDPHGHFFLSSYFNRFFVNLNSPPIGDVTCIDDMLTKLKEVASTTEQGKWISGFGYDDTLIAEKRHPTRYDLDKVSTDHPIAIRHISGHVLTANSKALSMGGVARETPQPDGGHIQKDPETGEPLGVLEENAAISLVVDFLPDLTAEKAVEAVAYGSKRYLGKGVTTAQDGYAFPQFLDIFLETAKSGQLKNRVHVLPSATNDLSQYRTTRSGTDLSGNNMVSLGAVKMLQDGSLQALTGCLSQPYYTLPDNRPDLEFNYHGYRINDPLDFTKDVIDMHKKGWQIAIHGNGDMAIEDCLNAFEAAQKIYPRTDARHIIIHCQTVREDQLDRIKRLGVIPAFFVVHTYYWGDRHESQFLGPARAHQMNPCRSALQRNIPFTNHNDDFVTPINPLLSIWSASNRLSTSGRVIGASQCVPVLEAVKSVTTYAAYQNHEEKLKGSLEPGKLADMVVLAENPLDIDPVKIKDIEILATIVGNEVVSGKV